MYKPSSINHQPRPIFHAPYHKSLASISPTCPSFLFGRDGSRTVLDDLTRPIVPVNVVMVMMVHQTFIHQQIQFVVLGRRLLFLLLRSHRHRCGDLLRRCRRLLLLAVGRFVPPEEIQPALFATRLNWSIGSRSRITAAATTATRPVLVLVFVLIVVMVVM